MEEAYDFIVKKIGLKYKDTVIIGCSGGPDSMALLHFMNKVKKELNLFLICAHVDHNVRKESEKERKDLEKYCDNESIYFEHIKIENYSDDNFENEARTFRYNYFDKLVKKYGAKFLMTAHHADDLIETILMRIVRGSTIKGYSGFKRIVDRNEYKIIRPFINLTKKDLLEYNKTNKIKYAIDKTNELDVHTRNRYRKVVLPFLKKEDPKVHLKFLKFSNTLLEYNDYVQKEMEKVINKIFKQGVLDIEKFLVLEHLLQVKIIYHLLESIYNDDLLIIGSVHVDLIFDLINSNKVNSSVHLPNNIIVTKAYNNLSFSFAEYENDIYEVEITNLVNLPNGMNIDKVDECDWTNNFVIRLSSKEVKLPLYVRTRRNGDKIEVKGMLGRKKVNNIFIDEKISFKERDIWPVVCDADDVVVWLPGLKKSKFDKAKNEEYDIILRYY